MNAVNGINVGIEDGECVVIMGESGTGKTTFLNLLSAVMSVDKGRIKYKKRDISKLNDDEGRRKSQSWKTAAEAPK